MSDVDPVTNNTRRLPAAVPASYRGRNATPPRLSQPGARSNEREPSAQHEPSQSQRAFDVPNVRLATANMDAGMYSILARIDECLLHRGQLGDTNTLNRIDELFKSRFREIGL